MVVVLPGGARLEWDPETGTATTFYPDGGYSACPVVPDDEIHARALREYGVAGYTAERHRLEHEVWHHLVGLHILGHGGSLVVWCDAHAHDQDPVEASREEWLVAALTHLRHGSRSWDHGAHHWLRSEGVDIDRIFRMASSVLDAGDEAHVELPGPGWAG